MQSRAVCFARTKDDETDSEDEHCKAQGGLPWKAHCLLATLAEHAGRLGNGNLSSHFLLNITDYRCMIT